MNDDTKDQPHSEGASQVAPTIAPDDDPARELKLDVPAKAQSTFVADVKKNEVWTFVADGRWTDWFIGCGPSGYRNFLADVVSMRPRAPDDPYFCLIGTVDGAETFRIGRGCVHRFERGGALHVFANDAPGPWYGNNSGSVRLRARRGGILPDTAARVGGIAGAWRAVRIFYGKTLGLPFVALLTLAAGWILAFLQQGRDLLRSVGEDASSSVPGSTLRAVAFAVSLLFLAIQAWFWSRTVVDSNFGLKRQTWHPRWLLEWEPRVIGAAPFGFVIGALLSSGTPPYFILGLAALMAAFVAFTVVRHRIVVRRFGRKAAETEDEPPWPFGRIWAAFTLVFALVAIVCTIADPVSWGIWLGAPAIVFVALGLIIGVMVTVIQVGAAIRLPVMSVIILVGVVLSFWVDAHPVGWRHGGPAAKAPQGRLTLAQAYARWRAVQPTPDAAHPLTMVLVASEGGASRAGFWTAEVLAALHRESKGALARHLFAINAVSGGSVGAVGYAAVLHDEPGMAPDRVRARLEDFAGRDALGPVMTGLLFPDLVRRFLPLPFIPDRAEALERAWEAAWKAGCAPKAAACADLLGQPFMTLGPGAQPDTWMPLVIVQGASEETGRRILTSKLVTDPREIDADDFYAITGVDVPISTAIHNGARFPLISPAGALYRKDAIAGHIVDGGYFDAAGVETVRELAQAIRDLTRVQEPLRIVIVFIGYREASAEAQSPLAVAGAKSLATGSVASTMTASIPAMQGDTQNLLNDVRAPVFAMLQSRSAHGAHLMRLLKQADASGDASNNVDPFVPVISTAAGGTSYVPVILCDLKDGAETKLEPPLDWTLSEQTRLYMSHATGFDTPRSGCGCQTDAAPRCTKRAIQAVVQQIAN